MLISVRAAEGVCPYSHVPPAPQNSKLKTQNYFTPP